MRVKSTNHVHAKNEITLMGIGFAVIYWIIESYLHVHVFNEGTLLNQIFFPAVHEFYMRLLVVGILISFSVFAQFIITKRKRAEEKLRWKNEELEQFVYTVSHDLKSPLITLQGFVSALEEDCGERLGEEATGHLGFIRDATKKMEVLIKDLLEFSRIGRVVHSKKEMDFSQVVEESLKVFGTRIEQEGIELVVANELPVVRCEGQRMVQVMENLFSNAIKFMGDNPSPRIEAGYREEDGFHRFWVKDNGIGIDPQYHEKIFELFQSLGEVEGEEGTGVGLAITRKIMEQHGGRVWVESVKGQGSTFYFTLPRN
jgi:signal transduction histidine kinase